jgi:hypothetical protein
MAVNSAETTLIDFTQLSMDYPYGEEAGTDATKVNVDNKRTLTDFRTIAGTTYSDNEKKFMKISLGLNRWEVNLASSARTVINDVNSMTRQATISSNAKAIDVWDPINQEWVKEEIQNKNVLGIRVHFPEMPYNSHAIVVPPFEIPAYADQDLPNDNGDMIIDPVNKLKGDKFDHYGVAKNIGILRKISLTTYGLNYPHRIGLLLKNEMDETKQFFIIDTLQFDGWKTLTWENPSYVTEVRNRELSVVPIYPKANPYFKLEGIVIYKDALYEGGDFIAYVKDIKLTYDEAVPASIKRDIEDESVWHILQVREADKREDELKKLGNLQVLRYLESMRMDNYNIYTNPVLTLPGPNTEEAAATAPTP